MIDAEGVGFSAAEADRKTTHIRPRPGLESAQPIIVILEGLKKRDVAQREFRRQGVWIWYVEVRVPAGPSLFDVAGVVWHWIDAYGLEHDHCGTPLDNAEEDVIRLGTLKRDVESEAIAIERERGWDMLDDKKRRDAGNFRFH